MQLYVTAVSKDSKGNSIDTDSICSVGEIGRLLLKICQVTPKGVLTFFKDSASMQMYMDEWRKIGVLRSLEEVKPFAVESTEPAELKKALKKFNDNVEIAGANFFLTMKGRCADTISFRDNMARAIILIGAPYPNYSDQSTKIQLGSHRALLHNKVNQPEDVAKKTAIIEPTINQIVRLSSLAIKHANDYGAIILVGEAYGNREILGELPLWMTENLKTGEEQAINLVTELHQFMKHASQSRVKDLHSINPHASFKADNEKLAARNELFRNLNPAPERKFVALNPERRNQIIEQKQRQEQERLQLVNQPSLVEESKETKDQTASSQVQEQEPVKQMTKVKLNIVEPSKPRQSDDQDLAITYIPNTESLRTTDNVIPLEAVMQGRDPRAKIMCNICYESDNHRFFASKCGHVSCEICWEIRLKDLMECPICKQKVRRKTLIEIVG